MAEQQVNLMEQQTMAKIYLQTLCRLHDVSLQTLSQVCSIVVSCQWNVVASYRLWVPKYQDIMMSFLY